MSPLFWGKYAFMYVPLFLIVLVRARSGSLSLCVNSVHNLSNKKTLRPSQLLQTFQKHPLSGALRWGKETRRRWESGPAAPADGGGATPVAIPTSRTHKLFFTPPGVSVKFRLFQVSYTALFTSWLTLGRPASLSPHTPQCCFTALATQLQGTWRPHWLPPGDHQAALILALLPPSQGGVWHYYPTQACRWWACAVPLAGAMPGASIAQRWTWLQQLGSTGAEQVWVGGQTNNTTALSTCTDKSVDRSWTWPQDWIWVLEPFRGRKFRAVYPFSNWDKDSSFVAMLLLLWDPSHEAGCHQRRTPGPLRGCSGRSATRTRNRTIPCCSVGQRRRVPAAVAAAAVTTEAAVAAAAVYGCCCCWW